MVSKTKPCGGCGETKSASRCIGCLHDFGDDESKWVQAKNKDMKMENKIDTSADLVARLRDHRQHDQEKLNHTWRRFRVERLEAADAIEALRAEVERLRKNEPYIRADERAKAIAEALVKTDVVSDWEGRVSVVSADAILNLHTPDSRAIAQISSTKGGDT